MTFKDLTGQRFGLLIVLYRAPDPAVTKWHVRCVCGTTKIVAGSNLQAGRTKSCGCQMTRGSHGQTQGRGGKPSGAYNSWHYMIQRCTNPNHERYPRYGGRGIRVCERWLGFEAFFEDMGPRPHGATIERNDANGNYEPGNCRWATTREQSRNKRSNVTTFDGVQEIIGRFEHGESQKSIGVRLGINPSYIGKIVLGKTWPEIDRPYLEGRNA